MDKADRAADLQEQMLESAMANRRLPIHLQRPNVVCGRCGHRNDRPEYAICTGCLESETATN